MTFSVSSRISLSKRLQVRIAVDEHCLERFGQDPQDIQAALDALSYLILHLAKVKASADEFEIIYEQSLLKPSMKEAFQQAVFPHLDELREILAAENVKDVKRFKDLNWRLNVVTSCRARQKVMVPKYTLKLDLETSTLDKEGQEGQKTESFVLDVDYTNLKRIQLELEEALKSIDAPYSKKVVKFLK